MIDNKLQFYQTRAGYDAQAEAGNIPNDALVFVKETHEIITHGEEDFGNSDKYGDIAYLGDQAGTTVTPEFNPQIEKKYIQDKDGTQVLPITHTSAVRDDAGNTLDSILTNDEQALLDESNRAKGAELTLLNNINTLNTAKADKATTLAGYGVTDAYTKSETYNKTELNNLITTPNQQYVTVTATDQTTSVTDVLPATGAADTTYRVGNWDGTQYNDSVFSEYAWNGSAYIKLSTKSQIGEVYDISANHAGATYADLAAALGTNGANVPQSLRKGGMSVKFVCTYDNKYVQYRLMADSWSINTNDWSFCGNDVLVENPEWIYVLLDAKKRILAGLKSDGSVEWSIGIPTPVKAYIDNAIAEIKNGTEETNLDGLNKIIAFLSDFSTSDTLKNLLDTKVDKEEGKSLVDSEYAEGISSEENPEFIDVLLSKNKKVLETTDNEGNKTIYGDCEIKGTLEAAVPHKMQVILDMDYGGDCDDAYALRLAGYYHSIGKIDVKMISSCYKNTPRVMGMLAQADYDGLGGIPVVAGDYEIETEPSDNYGANAAQIFPHSRVAPDGVGTSAFRKYLSQIKGKCTICTTGHLYNISDLINSEPDEWSPLNGNQLINEKVERFVVMGGRYDSNDYQYEFNFCDRIGSKEATLNFFANVSVPIYLCGFELCVDKYIGKAWNTNLDPNDKFRELEARFVEIWGSDITTVGRQAPDPLTVMFMCNDLGKNIGMPVTRGIVSLNSNAYTKFTANNSGTHYLMSCIYAPTDYEWRMNTLLWRKSW